MRIMGKAECSARQMARYLISKNPAAVSFALEYAKLYLEEGEAEGVRGDGAWIQSMKETGNFTFSGGTAVTFDQNNFCGMGVRKKGMKGESFDTPRLGIRAQIQHLKGYATADALVNSCIDPRYGYISPKGKAPTFEELAGKWAIPGYDTTKASSLEDAMAKGIGYGFDIVNGVEAMKMITEGVNDMEINRSYPAKYVSYGGKRAASAIKYIVVHYTGNKTDKAVSNAKYFSSAGSNTRAAGANYFVDDTSVYQSVDDLCVAYAVGGAKYGNVAQTGGAKMFGVITNANSLSVEMCSTNGEISSRTIENAVSLVKMLMSKYGIPAENVYRHFDVNGKNCPGWTGWNGNTNSSLWEKFKASLIGEASRQTPVPEKKETDTPFLVQLLDDLNIRNTPNGTIVKKNGCKKGVKYTIVEVSGNWGKLKSGAGWISINPKYVKRVG
ncbi:MAG: hypothetical protein E7300_01070 [Lachnospiraceae bacterium]|nr:hypothetical protein [Lachnospiraceae bacterium]